jgi:hypothetical protein
MISIHSNNRMFKKVCASICASSALNRVSLLFPISGSFVNVVKVRSHMLTQGMPLAIHSLGPSHG